MLRFSDDGGGCCGWEEDEVAGRDGVRGGGWILIYKIKLAHPPYFCMIANIPNSLVPLGIFVFGL